MNNKNQKNNKKMIEKKGRIWNNKKMKIKWKIAAIFGIILLCFEASVVYGVNTNLILTSQLMDRGLLYVGGSGPGNYSTIQDAINAANPGDTIYVYKGIYHEHVIVNKTINLIGEDRNTTIIDANLIGDVIYLFADYVNISGFTLRNSGKSAWSIRDAGIDVISAHCCISNNIFDNNDFGIYLWNPSFNIVINNTFSHNRWATHFYDTGNNNTISNNNFMNNDEGSIYIWNGMNNTVFSNTIVETNGMGIILIDSDTNKIFHNNLSFNNYGIYLRNDEGGSYSDFNVIYHNNLINNSYNAYDNGTNSWDYGYPSGGNYWSDYNGTDVNGDGIGDTPYNISGDNNQDLYPFMEPNGWFITPSLSLRLVGGFGITLQITNTGTTNAYDVPWWIHVHGGVFGRINKTVNGTVDVPLGESLTMVRTGLFLGFGFISIAAKAADEEQTAIGFQFIIFSMVKK